jgi:hypothetical protein
MRFVYIIRILIVKLRRSSEQAHDDRNAYEGAHEPRRHLGVEGDGGRRPTAQGTALFAKGHVLGNGVVPALTVGDVQVHQICMSRVSKDQV